MHPEPYTAFEDIIDGYFPLCTSIRHLMDRLGSIDLFVEITQAPIMDIPGLPLDAPVPLSIRHGRVGLIDRMHLYARLKHGHLCLSGEGNWRWLDGTPSGSTFSPQTRLAEPAFLEGFAQLAQANPPRVLSVKRGQAYRMTLGPAQSGAQQSTPKQPGWSDRVLLGPLHAGDIISRPRPTYEHPDQEGCHEYLFSCQSPDQDASV